MHRRCNAETSLNVNSSRTTRRKELALCGNQPGPYGSDRLSQRHIISVPLVLYYKSVDSVHRYKTRIPQNVDS